MKKILFFVLLSCKLGSLFAQGDTSHWEQYQSTDQSIKLSCPANWKKIDFGSNSVFASQLIDTLDHKNDLFFLITADSYKGESISLEQIVDFRINKLKDKLNGFSLISKSNVLFKGNKAVDITYFYAIDKQKYMQRQVLFLDKNNTFYAIMSFGQKNAYKDWAGIIQKIYDSVKLNL